MVKYILCFIYVNKVKKLKYINDNYNLFVLGQIFKIIVIIKFFKNIDT